MPLLDIDRIHTFHGRVEALSGVSLSVEPGEIVALLGANGAGKTTTLRSVSGLLTPQSGAIRFDGKPITGLSPEAIVRMGVSHVPEGRRVFPGLTVVENIILGASNRRRPSRRRMAEDVEDMFGLFPEIRPFSDTLCWKLSGGQLQMVALARGLMAQPRLLLLDEPSLGLAPLIIQQVFRIVQEIRKRGTTVLLVEQNAHMALSIADRGYVLETGRVVLQGDAQRLAHNDDVKAAYLGGRTA
ncbi:ABC transporter ATP-binding protein (plasmid) [Azospirillum oryzae]|uniref:ABC transporter ATP-binding protein n=1 Tax=Azospirillum oryzae TaxID=286727 RepID=A0A6N1ARL4_9PROT|nr:ABC transporter ATP-binding protein [Azospirillum oryzae]KAA0587857.1 ABC transporter ATP-binding protein [Azospirillum oryzae]QKS53973.1 ABC transporter ATP-binding protein [Azospirillum oryzae]GLR77772.1 ABC transporter ATP-binding protein [Azospirillum oryzae]